jgi:hypothetical protein
VISNNNSHPFWGNKGSRGMDGGNISVILSDGVRYDFQIQDFVFYVVHRSFGEGHTKKDKK